MFICQYTHPFLIKFTKTRTVSACIDHKTLLNMPPKSWIHVETDKIYTQFGIMNPEVAHAGTGWQR
jgi:hypothetical protein